MSGKRGKDRTRQFKAAVPSRKDDKTSACKREMQSMDLTSKQIDIFPISNELEKLKIEASGLDSVTPPKPEVVTGEQNVGIFSTVAKSEVKHEGSDPCQSKAEIMAERKAKTAEKKARKAAAALAKKATPKANNTVPSLTAASSQSVKNENQKTVKTNQSKDESMGENEPHRKDEITTIQFSPIYGNGKQLTQQVKKVSTYASQPFRRVHFDMKPMESDLQQPQPSVVEKPHTDNVHSAFVELSLRCGADYIVGIDAICVAFIRAFKQFLISYKLRSGSSMSRDLEQAVQLQLHFLTDGGVKQFPLALGNIVAQIMKEINQLSLQISEQEGKDGLLQWLDDFVHQNFDLALVAISSFCINKMKNALCILTFSRCPVVETVLLAFREQNQDVSMHVCVLDSPIERRGELLVRSLNSHNIECTYGMLSAVGYVIKQCRLVLLGCSAILSNGFVVSDRGASQVALVATTANVPVLVAAQTFKFVDRVQSFERGRREITALMNHRLETIPADLVTAIVTELRILPPSSALAVQGSVAAL